MTINDYHVCRAILLGFSSLLMACTPGQLLREDPAFPQDGYICFEAEAGTKAAESNLVENMTGRAFRVIAFEYQNSTTWDVVRATGKPSSSRFPFPTDVTADGESRLWSYDASVYTDNGSELVPWSASSRYSFFAYYPASLGNVTGRETAGVPVVSYSIDLSNDDPQNLTDVMTASRKDVINDGNGVVSFHFEHALSCLTFEARNFDEVSQDATEEERDRKSQYVRGLQVHLTSKMYTRIDIPLDSELGATASGAAASGAHYVVNSPEESTAIPALVRGRQIAEVNVAKGNNVFIIPQSPESPDGNGGIMGVLSGYVSFHCKDAEGNDTFRTGDPSREGHDDYREDLEFSSDKNFEAGKRYSLVINFTSNAQISIAIIESGDWTDSNQTITFE